MLLLPCRGYLRSSSIGTFKPVLRLPCEITSIDTCIYDHKGLGTLGTKAVEKRREETVHGGLQSRHFRCHISTPDINNITDACHRLGSSEQLYARLILSSRQKNECVVSIPRACLVSLDGDLLLWPPIPYRSGISPAPRSNLTQP